MKIKLFQYWGGDVVVEIDDGTYADALDITGDREFLHYRPSGKIKVRSLRHLRVFAKQWFARVNYDA